MAQLYANFIKAEMAFQLTYGLYFFALFAYGLYLFAPTFRDEKDRIYQVARILFLAAWLLNATMPSGLFATRSVEMGMAGKSFGQALP